MKTYLCCAFGSEADVPDHPEACAGDVHLSHVAVLEPNHLYLDETIDIPLILIFASCRIKLAKVFLIHIIYLSATI